MGPVLLQDEIEKPRENMRCTVQSNWTTMFSRVTKVTIISELLEAGINPSHTGGKHVHYHWAISTPFKEAVHHG